MKYKKNGSVLRKTILAGILALAVLTSACSARNDGNNTESSELLTDISSSSEQQDTVPESSAEQTSDEINTEDATPSDFSVIKDHFFGEWTSNEAPDSLRIVYGDENFCGGYNRVMAAYIDESGDAIMDVMMGGELHRHIVLGDDPNTMRTYGVNEFSADPTMYSDYTKIGEAAKEPTDVFGYFDMLEYCMGDNTPRNLMDEKDTPFNFFYNTIVKLDDGSNWERSANLDIEYPTLYLVEKSENSITMRSLFYPEGTELGADSASIAKEITFTVAKSDLGWQISSAMLS